MGFYNILLFVVLFNMILICKTWPHRPQENDRSKYFDEFTQKRDISVKPSTVRTNTDDIPIYFPGDPIRANFSAEGKGFNCIEAVCDDAKDYPYEHIQSLLQKHDYYSKFFGNVDGALVNQGSRIGEGEEPEDVKGLCETTTITKYPKTLLNVNRIEKYIINLNDDNKQGVVFETCVKTAHCKQATFPAGYVSKCVQKYSTVRLLALESERTKEPATDSFIIPSCCVCSLEKKKEEGKN